MNVEEASVRAQYLSFSAGGCDFALGLQRVREILPWEEATRVPSTPRSIRGVLNVRGSVVPVVDLAARLGGAEARPTRSSCILLVEATREGLPLVTGLVVDGVREVVELGAEEIEPPPSFGPQVRVDYLNGMGKVGRGFVHLLDLDRVLAAEDGTATPAS
jgi:purine-binding chemotaxis protein CheW